MSRKISGANAEAIRSTAPEVILAGPANCGKTFAVLIKIHRYCMANPGARVLMLRKTRETMNESTLQTWESEIYPRALLRHNYVQRGSRKRYRYPNAARVVIGGMDNIDKHLGGRWDVIYVNECHEVTEKEWQQIGSRLLATRGAYRQLIGDCNPPREGKEHWIWKRHIAHGTNLLFSDHRLNPKMTPDALARLESLTGDLRRRFYEGSWDSIAGDGLIKPEWWFEKYVEEDVWLEILERWKKDPTFRAEWVLKRGWDLAAGDSSAADYTVGAQIARNRKDGRRIISDLKRGRWSPLVRNETIKNTIIADKEYECLNYIWRPTMNTDMHKSVINAITGLPYQFVQERGSKLFRAQSWAPQVEAGNYYLVRGAWNHSLIEEGAQFDGEASTATKKDDIVDAVCLADKMHSATK